LGIEAEATDLSLNGPIELTAAYLDANCTPASSPICHNTSMRHDTAEGGAIYNWRHFKHFDPYGKFLVGFGSMDFPSNTLRPDGTLYSHDTRTIYAPGVGFEYKAWRHVAIRVDYEYQFWPHFLGHANPLNPSGFTLGAVYAIRPFHKHGLPSF
jgi:opacity protein-like surface antigen